MIDLIDRVFAYIQSDVMITGTISKKLIKVAESMVAQKATAAYSHVN